MDDRVQKAFTYALIPIVLTLWIFQLPELGILVIVVTVFSRKIAQIRKENKVIEQFPEFLLQLSSYIKYLPLEKALERIEAEHPLKEKIQEFKTKLESSKNITEAAMIFINSKNKLISLSGRILEIAYKTGKEMSHLLQLLGKEMIKENLRKKDAEIGLLIERYTLLIGGGILVPGILGIAFSFSNTLNIDFPEAGITQNNSMTNTILLANRIYLIIYSIVVGSFLESGKNRILYILVLMVSTQTIFTFSSIMEF